MKVTNTPNNIASDSTAIATSSTDSTSIDWQNDPRIAFDQVRQTWIFEDTETGAEYLWDSTKNSWEAAASKDEKDVDDLDNLEQDVNGEAGKKRKNEDDSKSLHKKQKKDKQNKREPPKNRGIYITNLPKDVTENELKQVFERYGLIADDLHAGQGQKRIKLYKETKPDDSGEKEELKGDALIVYFKPESVDLAIQMMDGAELRIGDTTSIVHVEAAQYQKDGSSQKEKSKSEKEISNVSQKKEKLKLQKTYQKMNEKLADWGDDSPIISIPMGVTNYSETNSISKRWEKVVILKGVFTLEEIEDPEARCEIEEDILSGAEEIGPVSKMIFFDAEPEGVVSIKFEDKQDADRCIRVMDGRYYSGRKLSAEAYDGRERYKTRKNKEGNTQKVGGDDDDDEEKRLEEFGKWLENQA